MDVIAVVGPAASGTSAVAGMLQALGVSMGNYQAVPGIRGYTTYEDRDLEQFTWYEYGAGTSRSQQRRLDLERYIHHRAALDPPPVIGFKGSPFLLLDPGPVHHKLRLVLVRRAPRATLESNLRTLDSVRQSRHGRRLSDQERIALAQAWAADIEAGEILVERAKKRGAPSMAVQFERLRSDPVETARALASFCVLSSPDIDASVKVVTNYEKASVG